jgi:rubrerythrin
MKKPEAGKFEHIWKCSVCFNDYVDSKHEDISVCPVCGSYNKKEEKGVAL